MVRGWGRRKRDGWIGEDGGKRGLYRVYEEAVLRALKDLIEALMGKNGVGRRGRAGGSEEYAYEDEDLG